MSNGWDAQELLEPIGADRPCGENLEDTHLLSSFDAFRLFGRTSPFDASEDEARTRIGQPDLAPDWSSLEARALDALRRSRDLRLLVHLGAAALRTGGLRGFCATLEAADHWLQYWWVETYPQVDDDALLRRNALNSFADRVAVLDELQRLPLVSSRQHGTFSLRDLEAGSGSGREPGPDALTVQAAFATTPVETLAGMHQGISAGLAAVRRLTARMRDHAGVEAAPDLEPLAAVLARMERVFAGQLALRAPLGDPGPAVASAGAASAAPVAPDAAGGIQGTASPGAVTSRDEAVRALDRVIEFFRRHEPSSPVPLLLERAKRLVSKDFLEVLADVAPEAVAQARAAGGLPPPEA